MSEIALVILALLFVETGGSTDQTHAIGDGGSSIGHLQISQAVIDDVNRVQDERTYTYSDRHNRDKSIEIATIYLSYWGKHYHQTTGKQPTAEVYARIWNGGPYGYMKPSTKPYWRKVQNRLTQLKL